MDRRSLRFILFFLGCFASGAAQAHPFGADFFSHRTRVSLSKSQIAIDYLLEIPTRHLNFEIKTSKREQQGDFQTQKTDEIRQGLRILVNGQPVELQQAFLGEDQVRARPHSYLYQLRLEGPMPDKANSLSIKNQNYPDERSYFRIDWQLSEALEVKESSLLIERDGQQPQDHSARWWMDDSLREFSMTFQSRKARISQHKTPWAIGLTVLGLVAGLIQWKRRHGKTAS
jgi:hypothetical protein